MIKEIETYTKEAKTVSREKVEKYNNQYDVTKHEIFTNKAKYPDRVITNKSTDESGSPIIENKIEPLNRIGLAYQKRIVTLGKIFQCGIPYIYKANPSKEQEEYYNAFISVIRANKLQFADMELTESCKKYTQSAELWYVVKKENEAHGFKSDYEIKCKVISPNDYGIFANFDEKDDLISIVIHSESEKKESYQVYTSENITTYIKEDDKWTKEDSKNAIGKIPLVLYTQDNVEWHDVQSLIEIAERQRTYQSESNKKFGEPILKLQGKVTGSGKSDGGGRVLQLENGADAGFIQPPNANQSFENEMQTNRRDIHELTQTPDISDDFFEGKGNVLSGVGRKLTWLPAHLKVLENNAIYYTALQRRISIIGSFLKLLNPSFENAINTLEIEPIITPFDIDNDNEMVEALMVANGNKPLISQQTSMRKYGIKDVEAEMKQIGSEGVKDFSENNT